MYGSIAVTRTLLISKSGKWENSLKVYHLMIHDHCYSILTRRSGHVVDQLVTIDPHAHVLYFFCQDQAPEALSHLEILFALVHQVIKPADLTESKKARLKTIKQRTFSAAEFSATIHEAVKGNAVFVVLDGIDQCNLEQRSLVFSALKATIDDANGWIKIFLSIGPDLRKEAELVFPEALARPITREDTKDDISAYIKGFIEQRIAEGKLTIRKMATKKAIHDELVKGADGM